MLPTRRQRTELSLLQPSVMGLDWSSLPFASCLRLHACVRGQCNAATICPPDGSSATGIASTTCPSIWLLATGFRTRSARRLLFTNSLRPLPCPVFGEECARSSRLRGLSILAVGLHWGVSPSGRHIGTREPRTARLGFVPVGGMITIKPENFNPRLCHTRRRRTRHVALIRAADSMVAGGSSLLVDNGNNPYRQHQREGLDMLAIGFRCTGSAMTGA